VDRYRPERFTELMGNEKAARETMAWVKQWDWCVFGTRRGKKRPKRSEETYEIEDEFHRPQQKVRVPILSVFAASSISIYRPAPVVVWTPWTRQNDPRSRHCSTGWL
jgi:hypothetical protein